MAVKLLEYYKHDIEQLQLVPSKGGRFEVTVDDSLIFSKLANDRFPEYAEVKDAIEASIAG
ncbi:MAG: SelT/SelW/SelH family protein [Gemmatimonadetes bacterium]|nr:SelT/SelW/SelH family protein [Gemmatimonadota bacterium]MYH17550.1 SelT/SelW/SelH family protein [Gemmatimonadota bacterium]MYK97845.1 SelT/SelW/SelH family protein [Gemmatimonadota bacterium]